MKIPNHLQDKIYWINPEFELDEHARRICSIDLLVSDLDDTIAPCQAKKIILDNVPKNILNPRMWYACATYLLHKFTGEPREKAWQKYKKYFFNNEERSKIKEKYTKEYAESTLFPGFLDFLSIFPEGLLKVYLTGNIPEIVGGYFQATNFDYAIADVVDKEKSIEKLLKIYPNKKRIWFSADNPEDEAALKFLKDKESKGEIDFVYSLYVTPSSNKLNEKYDINIPQNYKGIYELLRNINFF